MHPFKINIRLSLLIYPLFLLMLWPTSIDGASLLVGALIGAWLSDLEYTIRSYKRTDPMGEPHGDVPRDGRAS